MEATHSIDHVNQSSAASDRAVASPHARASLAKASTDSLALVFVMPITLAILMVVTILFPLR